MNLHEVLFASKMTRNSENSEVDFSEYVKKTQIDEMLLTLAGETVTGKVYSVNGTEITAKNGAEVFNDYKNNVATGENSHAEGGGTTASGPFSHAEGGGTTASGQYSHAEGIQTVASGPFSHAEGGGTKALASCSHAEGGGTTASEYSSHAEGNGTTASGQCSHAEGDHVTASGPYSHAEGGGTQALASCSHAEGSGTEALGPCSHAEGTHTKATGACSHVMGQYNVEDTADKFAFIIGNGTDLTARSNAFAIDWQGNIYVNNSDSPVNVLELMNRLSVLEAKVTALEAKEKN